MILAKSEKQNKTNKLINRIEEPDINFHTYGNSFDKEARNTHWKKIASSTNSSDQTKYPNVEE